MKSLLIFSCLLLLAFASGNAWVKEGQQEVSSPLSETETLAQEKDSSSVKIATSQVNKTERKRNQKGKANTKLGKKNKKQRKRRNGKKQIKKTKKRVKNGNKNKKTKNGGKGKKTKKRGKNGNKNKAAKKGKTIKKNVKNGNKKKKAKKGKKKVKNGKKNKKTKNKLKRKKSKGNKNSKKVNNKKNKRKNKTNKKNKLRKKSKKQKKQKRKQRKRNKKKKGKRGRKYKTNGKLFRNSTSTSSNSTCSTNTTAPVDSTCLQNAVDALNFDKNQITNFFKQKSRMSNHQNITAGKLGKKGEFSEIAGYMLEALGGNITNATCGSNSTVVITVSVNTTSRSRSKSKSIDLYNELLNCSSSIFEACVISNKTLNSTEEATIQSCANIFNLSRTASTDCRTNTAYTTNGTAACDCWRKAAIGITIAKANNCGAADKTAEITAQKNKCKNAFSACKKAEDKAIELIQTCSQGSVSTSRRSFH